MKASTAPPGDAWQLGAGPFIFAGSPPVLTGEIELVNVSDEPVRVRRIPTAVPTPQAKGAAPPLGDVRLGVRLAAKQRLRAPAQMFIDPTTPPGRYEATLQAGTQHERTLVDVFSSRLVELRPQPIELVGRAGESLSHSVIAVNRGNVSHRIPTGLEVFLEEHDWIGRALLFALRDSAADDSYQTYLDRALHEFRTSLASPARVRVTGEGRTDRDLAPGTMASLEVEIALPSGLVKGRRYFGSTPFLSSRLSFDVECTGSARARSAQ